MYYEENSTLNTSIIKICFNGKEDSHRNCKIHSRFENISSKKNSFSVFELVRRGKSSSLACGN